MAETLTDNPDLHREAQNIAERSATEDFVANPGMKAANFEEAPSE